MQGDFHSGNTRVAFSGTVSDPLNVGGIDLRLKFAGDSLRDLYDLTGVLPETPSFSTDGRLRADFTQNRMRFNYQNFNGRIGDSDIHGSLSTPPASRGRNSAAIWSRSSCVWRTSGH